MARTFIGELILRLQDQMSGKAKSTANSVSASMRQIEASAKRLSSAPWGVGFQRQLDRLKLSGGEMDAVRRSWISLESEIRRRNLTGALKRSEISGWKAATVGHFATVRAEIEKTERRAHRLQRALQMAMRPAYVALGAYTGVYMAGLGVRFAATAGSSRERELFRQDMANISPEEQQKIAERSRSLSTRYPSINTTDTMEMGRISRNLMGDTNRGLEVLDKMVQAYVTLQSAKGADVAINELSGLLRGLDNLGVNKDGQKGVELVHQMIEAMTRASQIEGLEFDAGKVFQFARRSKVAGPALSPEFLAISPAFMQDMGPDTAGNALGMAFKAFVLEAVGSAGGKKYLQERSRLGIRTDNGLIEPDLFGRNPYEWVKKHLVPALEKDGVNLSDETAIATAVGKTSGNTNATGLLTRMITQQEQIERTIGLYNRAMGTGAADKARYEDPFIAWEGFVKSLQNLSAAVMPMETISAGLNSLTNGINSLSSTLEDNPVLGGLGFAGGLAATGYAGYKVGSWAWGLITAGTNLNAAAIALQRAAVAQAGAGVLDGGSSKGGIKSGKGLMASLLGKGGLLAAVGLSLRGSTDQSRAQAQSDYAVSQYWKEKGWERGPGRRFSKGSSIRQYTSPYNTPAGDIHSGAKSKLGIDQMINDSRQAGGEIEQNLSVTAQPVVDTTSIDVAIGKARTLSQLLNGAAGAAGRANAATDRAMRRNYADYGVAP